MIHTYTHNSAIEHICGNMNGSWGHYAEWNNSDTERQILYVFTYIQNLKTKLIEIRVGGIGWKWSEDTNFPL